MAKKPLKINDKTVSAALKALREDGTVAEDANVGTKAMAKLVVKHIFAGSDEKPTPDHIAAAHSYLQAIHAEEQGTEEGTEDVEQNDEDASDSDNVSSTNSAVNTKYKKLYSERETKTGCSDEFDVAFRAKTDGVEKEALRDVLRGIATENGIEGERFAKWEALKNRDGSMNVGMIRMNLSNVLRAKHRKGEKVKIGKQVFAADPEKIKAAKDAAKAKLQRLADLKAKKAEKADKPKKERKAKVEAAADAPAAG